MSRSELMAEYRIKNERFMQLKMMLDETFSIVEKLKIKNEISDLRNEILNIASMIYEMKGAN